MTWLAGWSRRKKTTISGSVSGAQTDFQLRIDVVYDSDMRADFDDIRFTLSDGTTLIDFWLESKIDSTSAIVWVEVPSIPASPDTVDIYMYYGNPSAESVSSGANTFIQWHGAASVGFSDDVIVAQPYIYQARIKRNTGGSNFAAYGMRMVDSSDLLTFQTISSLNKVYLTAKNENISTMASQTPQITYNTWYNIKIIQPSLLSGILQVDGYPDLEVTSNLPDEVMGMYMAIPLGAAEQEWSFVRKYTSPEPTYEFGAETIFGYSVLLKNGTDFDTDLFDIHSTFIHTELNSMPEFSFIGYSLDATQKSLLVEGNEIIVIYCDRNIVKGVIREVTKDEELDEWTIVGDGTAVKLYNRESQDRTEWDNTAADTIVKSLLTGIMAEGTIDAADLISFRAEYGTILDRLIQLGKITNYDWYVSQGASPTFTDAFNFVSYRGQFTPAVENFKIGVEVGADIERIRDWDRIANSIAVMGWGDGPLQIKSLIDACTTNLTYLDGAHTSTVTTITVDDTSLFPASGNIWIGMEKISYTGKTGTTFTGCTRGVSGGIKAYAHSDNILVRDAQYTAAVPQVGSSIATNGIKQRTFPQLDIIDQDTLDRLAQRLIAEYKDSVERGWAVLSLDDFVTAVDLGDTISIEERDTTDKTNYRLLAVEYEQETLEVKIFFGTIKDYFLEDLTSMKKELDINNVYGAGAPNIDESLMNDNIELSFPLNHPFKIPLNTVAVGEMLIDIDLYPFRDYSKNTSGATSGTEAAHGHTMQLYDQVAEDLYLLAVNVNAHYMRKNSGCTAYSYAVNYSVTPHSHTIPTLDNLFGIQEDTTVLSSIQLELWLDGTKLDDTNTPALASVTGWDSVNDRLTGYSSYYGIDISNTTVITNWTPDQRYELQIKSVNASAHRCKVVSKLQKTIFIKGVKVT